MKRKIAVILRTLVIVLVGGIVISAGFAKLEASTVYKLKLATYHGNTYWAWPIYESLAKTVKERSGGRLQIQLFGSQSLVKARATHDAIISGVTDMGFIPASYFPGAFELQQLWDLPPLHSTAVEGTMWYKQIDDQFFRERIEKLGLHQLGVFVTPPYSLFTKSKPINTMQDFQGLTVKTSGSTATKMAGLLGAVPLTIGAAGSYEALQKGTIDGAFTAMATAVSYKWYETGKPGYVISMGGLPGTSCFLLMNKKVYNSLPGDLQKILDDVSWEKWSLPFAEGLDKKEETGLQVMLDKGSKLIVWSDSELQRLAVIKDQMWSEWAKEIDAKGMPGSKLVAAIKTLHEKK